MPCVLLQRKRAYAAHLSRWISTDPTWLADGVNLYAYVNGNPVSGVDPSGTTTEEKVDEGKVSPTFEEVEIKGEGGANEKNGSVNEIKNQIEDEDKILFDAWLYELINEPMDKDLIKGIDNEKNIVENSVFDFDDVGKKTLAHIKKINYSPLQKMIKEINEISKEKIKSSPVDKSNENPYFDTATNTIRYNSNQELFGNYVDQFIHELTHVLQKLEERYKSRPIPISLEVEAFKMQFESMESDGRTLMKNSLIWENYSVFKANQNNLSNYGTWLFRMIYSKQNEKDGIKIEKYNNDYIK
jgi:uncharacterized protein RhaS with RHS repeats